MVADSVVTWVTPEHPEYPEYPEVASLSIASHWVIFSSGPVVVGAFPFATAGVMVEVYPVWNTNGSTVAWDPQLDLEYYRAASVCLHHFCQSLSMVLLMGKFL